MLLHQEMSGFNAQHATARIENETIQWPSPDAMSLGICKHAQRGNVTLLICRQQLSITGRDQWWAYLCMDKNSYVAGLLMHWCQYCAAVCAFAGSTGCCWAVLPTVHPVYIRWFWII